MENQKGVKSVNSQSIGVLNNFSNNIKDTQSNVAKDGWVNTLLKTLEESNKIFKELDKKLGDSNDNTEIINLEDSVNELKGIFEETKNTLQENNEQNNKGDDPILSLAKDINDLKKDIIGKIENIFINKDNDSLSNTITNCLNSSDLLKSGDLTKILENVNSTFTNLNDTFNGINTFISKLNELKIPNQILETTNTQLININKLLSGEDLKENNQESSAENNGSIDVNKTEKKLDDSNNVLSNINGQLLLINSILYGFQNIAQNTSFSTLRGNRKNSILDKIVDSIKIGKNNNTDKSNKFTVEIDDTSIDKIYSKIETLRNNYPYFNVIIDDWTLSKPIKVSLDKQNKDIISNISNISNISQNNTNNTNNISNGISNSSVNQTIKFTGKIDSKQFKDVIKKLDDLNNIPNPEKYKNLLEYLNGYEKIFKSISAIFTNINEAIKNVNTVNIESIKSIFDNILQIGIELDDKKLNKLINKSTGSLNLNLKTQLDNIAKIFENLSSFNKSIVELENDNLILNNIDLKLIKNQIKQIIEMVNENPQLFGATLNINENVIEKVIDPLISIFDSIHLLNKSIIKTSLLSIINSKVFIPILNKEGKDLDNMVNDGIISVLYLLDEEILNDSKSHIDTLCDILFKLDKINKVLLTLSMTSLLLETNWWILKRYPNQLNKFLNGSDGKSGILNVLFDTSKDKIDNTNKKIIALIDILKNINKLNIGLFIAGLTSGFGILGIWLLRLEFSKFVGLRTLLQSISDIVLGVKSGQLQKGIENIRKVFVDIAIMNMALIIAGITALPAVVGMLVIWAEFKLLNKFIKSVKETLVSFNNKSNGLGNLVLPFKKLKELFVNIALMNTAIIFGAVLAIPAMIGVGFMLLEILMISKMLKVLNKIALDSESLNITMEGMKQIMKIVLMSSLILIVGALIGGFLLRNIVNVLTFTGLLALFIFAIVGTYSFVSKNFRQTLDSAQAIQRIIIVSAIALLTGALIGGFLLSNFGNILAFTALLALFIFAIVGTYALASKNFRQTLDSARGIQKLIIISAIMLLTGALLGGWLWKHALPILGFTVLLSLFILCVTAAYGLGSKLIQRSIKQAWVLIALIVISSTILLIAGSVIQNTPGMMGYIWGFTLALIVLLGGIALIAGIIGKNKRKILQGELLMLGIVAIVGISVFIMKMLADVVNSVDLGRLAIGAVIMVCIVAIFGGMVIGLAALSAATGGIAAGALGIGEALLAGIVGIVLLACTAISILANAIDTLSKVDYENFSVDGTLNMISSLGTLVSALLSSPLANPIVVFGLLGVSSTISALASAISDIAEAVQIYASLTIPIYNGKKIIGYRYLNDNDFTSAGENVKKIVMTLANAVLEIYNANPNLFRHGDIRDFLGYDTPFTRVVKSLGHLGTLISDIASGVKDYATLKFGKRGLTDNEIQMAGVNIERIINTMLWGANGTFTSPKGGIISVYNAHPELFTSGGFNDFIGMDTPLTRTIKTLGYLGDLITDISAGVKDYATLKFGDVQLDDGLIVKAGENILDVIQVMLIGKDNGTSFTDPKGGLLSLAKNSEFMDLVGNGWDEFWGNDNDATRMFKTLGYLGDLISNIAAGVKAYATLNFGGIQLEKHHIVDAGKNIVRVINAILVGDANPETDENGATKVTGGIIGAYNAASDFFKDSEWWDFNSGSSYAKHTFEALGHIGELMSSIAQGVLDLNNLTSKIPDLNEENKITTIIKPLNNYLNSSFNVVKTLYDSNKKTFSKDIFDDSEKLLNLLTSISQLFKTVEIANKSIENIINSKVDMEKIKEGGTYYNAIKGLISLVPAGIASALDALEDYDIDNIEDLEEQMGDYVKVSKNIKEILDNSISTLLRVLTLSITDSEGKSKSISIDDINSKFNENGDYYKAIYNLVYKLPYLVYENTQNLPENINVAKYNLIIKNYKGLFDNLSELYSTVSTTVNEIITKAGNWNTLSNYIGLMITRPIKSYNYILDIISKNQLNTSSIDQYFTFIDKYKEILQSLSEAYLSISTVGTNTDIIDTFINSNDRLIEKFNNIKINNEFEQYAKDFEGYVNTINSIDTTKVNSLTSLSNSIVNLSNRIGNLSEFTNKVIEKLGVVLIELARKIEIAEKTIKNADQLNKVRQEMIHSSIAEFKTILDNPLNVYVGEIKNEETNGMFNDLNGLVSPNSTQDNGNDGGNVGSIGSQSISTDSEPKCNNSVSISNIDALANAIVQAIFKTQKNK